MPSVAGEQVGGAAQCMTHSTLFLHKTGLSSEISITPPADICSSLPLVGCQSLCWWSLLSPGSKGAPKEKGRRGERN